MKRKNPTDKEFLSHVHLIKQKSKNFIFYDVFYDLKNIGTVGFDLKASEVFGIAIDEDYQRKGIASFIYDHIEREYDIKLKPSQILSYNGQKFWQNRRK